MGRSKTLNYSWEPTLKHAHPSRLLAQKYGVGVGERLSQRLTWEMGNSPFLNAFHIWKVDPPMSTS